jgi:hypothetical protein
MGGTLLQLNVSPKLLERIAQALEGILQHLQIMFPAPQLPNYPEKPFGREAVTYLDEQELCEKEERERLGLKPLTE